MARRYQTKGIAILMSLALLTYPCKGDSPTKTITIMGYRSCETWIRDHTKNASGEFSDKLRKTVDETWLVGFMSGANAASGSYFDDTLRNVDSQIVIDWVDRYCGAHPDRDVTDGGMALFHSLVDISKKRKHEPSAETQKSP
jgi:hypothetical protein